MDQRKQRATHQMTADTRAYFRRGLLRLPVLAAILAVAVGFATPSWSQQTTPTPQTPQTPQKQPQPQVKLVQKAKHGDWSITCPTQPDAAAEKPAADPSGKGDLDTGGGDNPEPAAEAPQAATENCFMMQAARHSEKEELAVSVMVFKNTVEGKTVSQLRVNVPAQFYVLLPAGIGMEIDGDSENAEQLQYMFCPPPGLCIAIKDLNEALLERLKGGSVTKFYVWDVRRRGAVFELSLKGFTKAYEEM